MESEILFQTSIIAAFFAGMVALFAPCCVSYLLPAYLGSVFKERKRVLFMTIIYSLGIFIVMLPAVLGSKLISIWIFRYHNQLYFLGGVFMVVVGVLSLLGIKLPMPKIQRSGRQGTDVLSIFTLGIFSGLTSACCAPVLVGVLTLSVLSPSLWQSLFIGFVYVLGMVIPLYISSYFLDSKKVLGATLLRKNLYTLTLLNKKYHILTSNLISFTIFTIMGFLILYLVLATDFSMSSMAQGFSTGIGNFARLLNNLPGAQIIFGLIIIAVFVFFIWKSLGGKNNE